jgi:hypothetical protein
MKKFACLAVLLLALPVPSWAAIDTTGLTTIHFDELPPQPANGVSFAGVTFGFTGGTATFDAPNGGNLTYVQDPTLEGDTTGTLTLNFSSPTQVVQFGVAISNMTVDSPGFTVQLFSPSGALIGTFPVTTTPLVSFSEGQFSYNGAFVKTAVITFTNSAISFAIDNLTFGLNPVPTLDPVALTFLALAVAVIGGVLVRRKTLS